MSDVFETCNKINDFLNDRYVSESGGIDKETIIGIGIFAAATTAIVGSAAACIGLNYKRKKTVIDWYAKKHNIKKVSEFTKKIYKAKAFGKDDEHEDKELANRLKVAFTPNKVVVYYDGGKPVMSLVIKSNTSYGYETSITITDYKFFINDSVIAKHKNFYLCSVLLSYGSTSSEISDWFDEQYKEYEKERKEINKKTDVKKESVEAKLNIYDSYESGFITESEKDYLLSFFEATIDKEKQKILDNQDVLKTNFKDISTDLKKMVLSNASGYKLNIEDKKFFSDHKDHHEQHYLLTYTLKSSDDLSKREISKILASIGDNVEKEFNKSKKEFLDKGLYFDNKKKDAVTRFVELHYDFY